MDLRKAAVRIWELSKFPEDIGFVLHAYFGVTVAICISLDIDYISLDIDYMMWRLIFFWISCEKLAIKKKSSFPYDCISIRDVSTVLKKAQMYQNILAAQQAKLQRLVETLLQN